MILYMVSYWSDGAFNRVSSLFVVVCKDGTHISMQSYGQLDCAIAADCYGYDECARHYCGRRCLIVIVVLVRVAILAIMARLTTSARQ
jgi:hypothetical protein